MKTMRKPLAASVLALSLMLATACAEPTPEVTPAPEEVDEDSDAAGAGPSQEDDSTEQAEAEETSAEETEETEEADEPDEPDEPTVGSREAPLALGETRKLSTLSAYTVGVTASNLDAFDAVRSADPYHESPGEDELFVLAEISIQVDASALADQGFDISDGAEPGMDVIIEFVGNEGRSYDGLSGTWCYMDDALINSGPVYNDGATVTGTVCVAAPRGEVEGGLWRIPNYQNDAVWVQIN